jgi:hypothetical protein
MTLAPVTSRLDSFCLPIATARIAMGRVPYLTVGRGSLVAVVGLALVRCQTVAATVHCCYASDDKDNGEETEDQDVEHGPLDHGPLEMSCPHPPGSVRAQWACQELRCRTASSQCPIPAAQPQRISTNQTAELGTRVRAVSPLAIAHTMRVAGSSTSKGVREQVAENPLALGSKSISSDRGNREAWLTSKSRPRTSRRSIRRPR